MPEWNKLPKEMQEMVVKRATENTRNALKHCSTSSKKLVEETRLEKRSKNLFFMRISEYFGKWTIQMTPHRCSHMDKFDFSTFEEFQEKLIEIIKSIESIRSFNVSIEQNDTLIKLMSDDNDDQRRIFVKNARFMFKNWSQQEEILSRIEPVYLRRLELKSERGTSSRIYDMQQVIFAENLSVYNNCSIREDQLLKLRANKLSLENVNCSILEYIAKCALEAETTLPMFAFSTFSLSDLGLLKTRDESSNNEVMFKTPNPQLMLEIKFSEGIMGRREKLLVVNGAVRCHSESCKSGFWRFGQYQLRIIDFLRILFEVQDDGRNCWKIFVERKSCALNKYRFGTIEELQEKLNEIMDNLDFIKRFRIDFKNSPETINWKPRKKQLMIDNLIVHGDSSMTSVEHLLRQVDPNFFKQVSICEDDEIVKNGHFYDLPQIQNATIVTIDNPYLQDHQLLKMNNLHFEGGGEVYDENLGIFDGAINETLTAEGINQFIKKCVGCGKAKEINFNLGKVLAVSNETELFEGLDVVEVFEMEHLKRFVLNTVDSEYFMEIRISDDKHLSGYLIPREKIKPGELYRSDYCFSYFNNL